MKKIYEAPTSELIYIASSDIITESPVADVCNDDFEADILNIRLGN